MSMEVASAVGGAFLAPLKQVVFDRISTSSKFSKFFKGKKVIIIDEEVLDRLNQALYKIFDVLEDAQVKEGSTAVRTWLGKVRAKANYADDLLDEFNTECLRLQLHEQIQADLNSSLKSAYFKKLIQQLIKVTTTLEDLANQVQELGLGELDPKREPSSSMVDNSLMIFGRDDEKNELIERVLSDGGASDVSVIPITGMGGIGKTTLAQLVYNDDRVKKKFSTRAWVCVSEEYDAITVTRSLLMEVNSAVVDEKDGFNRMQFKLKDNLKGKCFLIILDDIWNENSNDWDILKNPLINGSRGSKIIVTTRNENIAMMMQNEPFHHVGPIPEDHSWCLFKSHAFDKKDHKSLQEFETIGKEIVKKCYGLPLAIKSVAGALRSNRDIDGWHKFLNSEIWANGGDIMPALRLSYKHLPSHLKSCFAFCALFPKDIPFGKDEVVLLWMANDLVKPSTQKDGREYFEELKSRSFFDSVNENKYFMHDLINDLARSVSGNTCITLEDYQAIDHHHTIQRENELQLPRELLHFSYLTNSSSKTSKKLRWLAQVQGLRTFLPIHQEQHRLFAFPFSFSDMFPRFQRLRALNLRRHDISMVPDSIGDLKHLRFLNLASTKIKRLPRALCKCLNLQTLILTNCQELVELPEEMRLLINLQHLDVRGVGEPLIKTMATWLTIIKDIQNISVVVDKIYGNVLEHLAKLQLCQSLNIIGLEDIDVVTAEGAKIEELKDESCIENLTLEWSHNAECSELMKFAKLEPHTNIKKLSIKGYTGSRFPDWLGVSSFSNMEFVSLKNCKNCLSLPPLGQLTGLKTLKISGIDGISEIGKEFYGDDSASKPFQALEKLVFREMAEWAKWSTHSVVFPSLKSLSISNCNNILSFPEGGLAAPNLKVLEVNNCKKMKSLPAGMHTQLPLLNELIIEDCPEIECFPEGGLPHSLETLDIWNCSKVRNCQINWGLQALPSLKKVSLNGFEDTLFPEEGSLPTSLQHLSIGQFSNLDSLNEEGLQHLSSLQTLQIHSCLNLKYLPQQKFSSSLSEVYIRNCELVESFPEGLASSLSNLIIIGCRKLAARIQREKVVSHIPNIEIW